MTEDIDNDEGPAPDRAEDDRMLPFSQILRAQIAKRRRVDCERIGKPLVSAIGDNVEALCKFPLFDALALDADTSSLDGQSRLVARLHSMALGSDIVVVIPRTAARQLAVAMVTGVLGDRSASTGAFSQSERSAAQHLLNAVCTAFRGPQAADDEAFEIVAITPEEDGPVDVGRGPYDVIPIASSGTNDDPQMLIFIPQVGRKPNMPSDPARQVHLTEIEATLSCRVAEARLPADQLQALDVGDLIPIRRTTTARLLIDGAEIGLGVPGTCSDRRAIALGPLS
ncbi:MAG: FliM/FliN family flagellar motor C-terminal domain-containing protein [Pacificimonas sp.]